ncbi:unnamed protein product, partial [Choristocarpus tenellus]
CRACLTLPCKWAACADHVQIGQRKEKLQKEIQRLMGLHGHETVESLVSLSCVRGGNKLQLRKDVIRELRWETRELDRHLTLVDMDKELHDAFGSTKNAIRVTSLHHYPTLMWRKDAKIALEKERDSMLAHTMAVEEIVDDLFESMLEGWVFGERQAEHPFAGFVPPIKADGFLRPGDQRSAAVYLEHRQRKHLQARARGEIIPQERRGTHYEKAVPIEECAQNRILTKRVEKKMDDHKHLLKEVETTLKFGVFSMVLSFLHSLS